MYGMWWIFELLGIVIVDELTKQIDQEEQVSPRMDAP